MNNAKDIVERILGHVEWQSPVRGLCLCPGEKKHTHPAGIRDCRVSLDGIPVIHCFHSSCSAEVVAANKELRRELWNDKWGLRLPGGGAVQGLASNRGPIETGCRVMADKAANERLRFWQSQLAGILKKHRWPRRNIIGDCPQKSWHLDAKDHFKLWLTLWHPDDVIWIGDVRDSGRPEHAGYFRRAHEWRETAPAGMFTSGATYHPHSFTRSKLSMSTQRYQIVESDELAHDEIGAVFAFLRDVLNYGLHAVVDTGGRSLHGWFSPPRTEEKRQALKLCLKGLKCDPRMFSLTQPVRVPGVLRGEKYQQLLYIR